MNNRTKALKEWYAVYCGMETSYNMEKPNTDHAKAVMEKAREGRSESIWTQSSERINWKGAVKYCQDQGARLQTLDEVVQYRCENNKENFFNEFNHTNTLIGYVNEGSAGLRAFVFEPMFEQTQELIKHPQIGNIYLQIPIKNALAKQVKESAKNRTFIVPAEGLALSVVVDKQGESEYGSNEIVKMLMPQHARNNARYIANMGYESGFVWFDKLYLVKGDMRIRLVGLGGGVGCYINYVEFSRIQNTPDLMPSDITGTYIIEENDGKRSFKFQPGPIFANIVLADEINRATPKTQSALLEAMQEKQVTVGNKTFELDKPFFVLATQNPIEQEGTYPLPEAQSDRFLLKILVGYPKYEDEIEIVTRYAEDEKPPMLKPVIKKESILQLQKLTRQVPVSNDLKKYVVDIVSKTRTKKDLIEYGASPRASIGLILASKARALMDGRKYVSKEDINALAYPVLRHRIILNFEAERKCMTTDDAIKALLR